MTCAMKPRVNRWVSASVAGSQRLAKIAGPCHSDSAAAKHQKPGRGQEEPQRNIERRRLLQRKAGRNHGPEISIS